MPLKLVKIKSSKNWYVRGTVSGQSVFESTGTDRKEFAEARRIKLETKLHERAIYGERKTVTFVEAAARYLEAGRSSRHMQGVIDQFEFTPLASIGQRELDAAAKKAYPAVKPQTLNRHFYTPFIAVMNFATQDGLCDFRKWRRPRVKRSDTTRAKWFSYEDAARFYAAAPPHLKAIFVFCVYTGARITEAVELQLKDINLESRWAVLNASKTDGFRGVPLHNEVVSLMGKSPRGRNSGHAFLTQKGLPYASHRLPDGTVQGGGYFKTTWNATLSRAGLAKTYTPYSMRHTFNNWLILAGIDQATREALMGHDSGSTNAIYSDAPQSHLIEAIDRLKSLTDFSQQNHVVYDSFVQSSARNSGIKSGNVRGNRVKS